MIALHWQAFSAEDPFIKFAGPQEYLACDDVAFDPMVAVNDMCEAYFDIDTWAELWGLVDGPIEVLIEVIGPEPFQGFYQVELNRIVKAATTRVPDPR